MENENKTFKRQHSSLKCWFGAHRYEVLETIEVKNKHDEVCKHIYVSRCVECGKIKRDEIPCEQV